MQRSIRARKNAEQLQAMLQTPTNNFGLAQLFKNFVLLGEDYQLEQVSGLRCAEARRASVQLRAFGYFLAALV